MDKKKIIDRVVKLLALSENNSETAEAKSAAEMAAKLMAKYDINIIKEESNPNFHEEVQPLTSRKPQKYESMLINTLCKFNGVALITRSGGMSKAEYIFIGREIDIEHSHYMIDIVLQQMSHSWKSYLKDQGKISQSHRSKLRKLWKQGFSLGVSSKLRELNTMKNTKIQEYGIVPVDMSKQALDSYSNIDNVSSSKSRSCKYNADGFKSGQKVSIHEGIKNSGKKLLLA